MRTGSLVAAIRRCLVIAAASLLTDLVAGCVATPRLDAPAALLDSAVPVGFPEEIRTASIDWRELPADASGILNRARHASTDGRIHILALSGGGAGGAFGAGALVGLTERAARPQFEIVTGVSTGALLAPFAFLGPSWNVRLTEAFNGTHSARILTRRSVDLLFRPSVYRGGGLFDLVDRFVTPEMIEAVAREAAEGRLLLVATTDLDKEEPVIWNLGAIAAQGGPAARRLFRDVVLASASIPGILPPVVIRVHRDGRDFDELHVDGANTVPFFILPDSLLLAELPHELLEGGEIYVLINGQMTAQPQTTPVRTVPIVARSLSAGMRHLARSELALTAEFAQRYRMRFRFATLPIDHAPVRVLDLGAANMGALYAYGRDCAARGLLWVSVDQAEASGDRALAFAAADPTARAGGRSASCPLDETVADRSGPRASSGY